MDYYHYRPRYRKFTFKAPDWIIRALLEESDKTYTPAAVYLVELLRKHFKELGYGPRDGQEE